MCPFTLIGSIFARSKIREIFWICFRESTVRKKSRIFKFANELKSQVKIAIFCNQWRSLTSFSTENAISKISRGFNFANELSHTILRVLFLEKQRKFAKPLNLISRKLIRLKYSSIHPFSFFVSFPCYFKSSYLSYLSKPTVGASSAAGLLLF